MSSSTPTAQASRFADSVSGLLRHVNVLVPLACLWLLVVDSFTRVPMGASSLSGILTVVTCAVALALSPVLVVSWQRWIHGPSWPRSTSAARLPVALLLFALLAFIRLPSAASTEGLQNVCVYGGFVLVTALVAETSRRSDLFWFDKVMPLLAALVSLIFLVTLELMPKPFYGARPFALSSIVFMAMTVPQRARGIYRYLPLLVLLASVLSLSRTASLICMMMLIFMVVRLRKGHRARWALLMIAGTVLSVVGLWFFYAPFRNRFTGGDAAVSVGGTAINTSGRTEIWAFVFKSAMRSPIIGQGPGSASEQIIAWRPNIGHPHDEYLRIFHDFGVIGLALWVWALIALTVLLVKRVRRYDRSVDWAALMALIGIMLASLTDNIIVYPFVMIPAAALIGLSLGRDPVVDERTRRSAPPALAARHFAQHSAPDRPTVAAPQ